MSSTDGEVSALICAPTAGGGQNKSPLRIGRLKDPGLWLRTAHGRGKKRENGSVKYSPGGPEGGRKEGGREIEVVSLSRRVLERKKGKIGESCS